jgi:hypothetical protein
MKRWNGNEYYITCINGHYFLNGEHFIYNITGNPRVKIGDSTIFIAHIQGIKTLLDEIKKGGE